MILAATPSGVATALLMLQRLWVMAKSKWITNEQVAWARERRADGVTWQEISRSLGCTAQGIRDRVNGRRRDGGQRVQDPRQALLDEETRARTLREIAKYDARRARALVG